MGPSLNLCTLEDQGKVLSVYDEVHRNGEVVLTVQDGGPANLLNAIQPSGPGQPQYTSSIAKGNSTVHLIIRDRE